MSAEPGKENDGSAPRDNPEGSGVVISIPKSSDPLISPPPKAAGDVPVADHPAMERSPSAVEKDLEEVETVLAAMGIVSERPENVTCPKCHYRGLTKVKKVMGCSAVEACLCCCLCCPCCCLVGLACLFGLKDVKHSCQKCGAEVARLSAFQGLKKKT